MIASLIYNTPELIPQLKRQVPQIYLIDAGSDTPIKECHVRYNINKFWVGNWERFLMTTNAEFVWMLNSDITDGASIECYRELVAEMRDRDLFMITPAFNSPHLLFDRKEKIGVVECSWIDMCAPLINVQKYRELGGFDLQFKGYFADVDLCYRARKAGMKMAIDYNYYLTHAGSYTVIKENKWEQANGSDAELICKKYGVREWGDLL